MKKCCSVCAGIVLFNPDLDILEKNVQSLSLQLDKIYMFNNGSDNTPSIKNRFLNNEKVEILDGLTNQGIASALNCLCHKAIETGYEWILTLDQDSFCYRSFIEKLMRYSFEKNIGIVCPNILYDGFKNKKKQTKEIETVSACMTSGSLTNLKAFSLVGGFKEDYFIDYVDNDFCMKLRLNGFKILRVRDCEMSHKLGKTRTVKIMGLFKRNMTYHEPWRVYYMARNNLDYIFRYRKNINYLKELLKLRYVLFLEFFASTEKKAVMRYIKKGINDAKKGTLGVMPN